MWEVQVEAEDNAERREAGGKLSKVAANCDQILVS